VQMVANITGGGAVLNTLARQVGASVTVIDVGVGAELAPRDGLVDRRVAPSTDDLSRRPAMTVNEALAAVGAGIGTAHDRLGPGHHLLVTGDLGIANITPSGRSRRSPTWAGSSTRPGGLLLGAASRRTTVILDGVIACSSGLVARALCPGVTAYLIAGHRSRKQGASVALEMLGLETHLDLRLRLGEGSGATLTVPVVQAAARLLRELATFGAAGSRRRREPVGATPARPHRRGPAHGRRPSQLADR